MEPAPGATLPTPGGCDVAIVGEWRSDEAALRALTHELQRRGLRVQFLCVVVKNVADLVELSRSVAARLIVLMESHAGKFFADSLRGPEIPERLLILDPASDAHDLKLLVAKIQARLETENGDRQVPSKWGTLRGGGRRGRGAGETAGVSAAARDAVNFSTFAPSSVAPGSSFILDLWAHLAEQSGIVEGYAGELGRDRKIGVKAGVPMERGAVLEAALELPDFETPEPFESLVWTGEPANCSFPAQAPPGLAPGNHPGVIRLSIDSIPIGRVHFAVQVQCDAKAAAPAQCTAKTVLPRTAFACYSSQDRDEVLGRIQGMVKVWPTLQVFLDVLELRSGEDWERTIRPHVDSKDVFYLFWSASAARSEEVAKEWCYAFRSRGISYIDPIPLVDPRDVPPPDDLKSLHFNDRFLAHIETHRRINRTKEKRTWWRFGATGGWK